MEKDIIIKTLKERGYDSRSANLVTPDLQSLSSPLNKYLEQWIYDASNIHDFCIHNYSVIDLMNERKMSYPAALLTIDWIIKDPDNAINSLRKGIK